MKNVMDRLLFITVMLIVNSFRRMTRTQMYDNENNGEKDFVAMVLAAKSLSML